MKLKSARERFLQAECDRMVEVVKAAREAVRLEQKYASTPQEVERSLCAIRIALTGLDRHRSAPVWTPRKKPTETGD